MESFDAKYVRITDSKFTLASDVNEAFVVYVDTQHFHRHAVGLMIKLFNASTYEKDGGDLPRLMAVHVDNCEFVGSKGINQGE